LPADALKPTGLAGSFFHLALLPFAVMRKEIERTA